MMYDRDIREPLFDFLEESCGRVRIIEEKTIGRSRADVVMVMEDGLCGIEIKSDADTYARLSRQVGDYDRCFDYNIAVVGTRHAVHIGEHVPDYWGIITVEELESGPDFYFLRRPGHNPNVEAARKIRILWRTELSRLLAANALPAYREKSKDFVRKKLVERVPKPLLDRQISEELFERDYTTIGAEIEAFRKSVRAGKLTGAALRRRPAKRRRKKRL